VKKATSKKQLRKRKAFKEAREQSSGERLRKWEQSKKQGTVKEARNSQ
jgi:hypothetical protein